METYLKNFTLVATKPIILNKHIDDANVRLYGERYNIYIFDANDIRMRYGRLDLYTTPKTHHMESFNLHNFVYPYIGYKSKEDMENEPITEIKVRNVLISKKTTVSDINIFTRLCKTPSGYALEHYVNNQTIKKLTQGQRDHMSMVLFELVSNQTKSQIISEVLDELTTLTAPAQDNYTSQNDTQQTLPFLKPSVNLYPYQLQDLQWMDTIENAVRNNQNSIIYSFSIMKKVVNDQFVMFNQTLIPASYINDSTHKLNTITFRGGNIISEVGLGKTIVALSHLLKCGQQSRPMYDRFIQFDTNCNYAYKRGANKGTFCNKKIQTGELYCTAHRDSLFIEKRKLVHRNLHEFDPSNFVNGTKLKTNASLVICPNQLCDQWVKEYYDKFDGSHRVLLVVTRDQFKNLTVSDILFADVVVVSYQFLLNSYYQDYVTKALDESDFKTGTKFKTIEDLLNSRHFSSFNLFKWNSVVLDEAHEIQNMSKSGVLKSIIYTLDSISKWNITGTPFANGLDGYLNLMSYNTTLNIPHGTSLKCYTLIEMGINSKLVKTTANIFRCNTKEAVKEQYIGNIIKETVKLLKFTPQERSIYNSHLEGGRTKYNDFLIKLCCHSELYSNTKELIQNCKTFDEIQKVLLDYNQKQMQTLAELLQEASHDITAIQQEISNTYDEELLETLRQKLGNARRVHTLTKTKHDNVQRTYNYLKQAIDAMVAEDSEETCAICLDTIEKNSKAITKCGHKFCWECLHDTHKVKQHDFKCPICNNPISTQDIYVLQDRREEVQVDNSLQDIINKVKSTKIGSIIHYLQTEIQKNDKVILFSQWDEMLHKVGSILEGYKLNLVYCNGSVYQRKRAIQQFSTNADINIIMLSSRNAASGINLTAANKIILLEPVYGSIEYRNSIESQAVGRADRIGQKRPIEVCRFIIEDTIEEDILKNNIDDSKMKQLVL